MYQQLGIGVLCLLPLEINVLAEGGYFGALAVSDRPQNNPQLQVEVMRFCDTKV